MNLPEPERAVLRRLPEQLKELLTGDDPALERLFPPAHPEDPALNLEYEHLVRGDLLAGRMASVEIMESTLDSSTLDEEQLLAWVGALNDMRLVLGTKLGVTEDLNPDVIPDRDPEAPTYALFYYLGWLEEQAVEALSSGGAPGGTEVP